MSDLQVDDKVAIPAKLEGPFELSGYDYFPLAQSHLAELPDGTTIPLPPGTKLHRIGSSGPLLIMNTGNVESSVGALPTITIDA